MMAQPDVTKYMSARDYLMDLYNHRKSTDPNFSYQSWSQELGIKNRSFLRHLVSGQKQITATSRDILVRGLKLQGLEREYFEILVAYSQCKTPEKKDQLQTRLLSILRTHHDVIEVQDVEKFYSNPYFPALGVLLTFNDLNRTPEVLALLFSVTAKQMQEWLESLEQMQLAVKEESGQWRATHRTFRVPDLLGNLPRQRFNTHSLKLAAQAVQLPVKSRRFRNLLLALSEAEYDDFLTELNEFVVKTLSRYNHSSFAGRTLYQFTSALFPALPVNSRVQEDSTSENPSQNEVAE